MFQSVLFSSPKTNSKLKYFSWKSIFCLYSDHLSRVLKLKLRMISCDLFFFRFKNTWQLLFQSWESCTMKLWKIISLKLPIFSQCVPKKGVWRLLEAFQLAEVGWVLAPTSGPAQITVFCDWQRSTGHTHPSPGSEKNKTKYSRLHLSDAVCLERAERGLTADGAKKKVWVSIILVA